jgi:aryl-alcohol dehydrogenase-like predicted oxidoreductase
MVRHLTIVQYAADYEARPEVDGRGVTLLIPAAVSQVLDIADTWLGSDGAPIPRAKVAASLRSQCCRGNTRSTSTGLVPAPPGVSCRVIGLMSRMASSRQISEAMALGCGNFGGVGSAPEFFGQGLSDDQAFGLMDAAWELGIRHFDTADAYGGGRSERAIGRWMASRSVRPAVTTKTFNPMTAGADHGLNPDRITRQLTSSLDRLGIDRVDLYLAHDFDPEVPLAESFAAFESARRAGLIGGYGVSNFGAAQLAAALAAGAPRAVQNSYSLLDRGDAPDLLDLCARHEVAYLAFSPLAGGWLTGKYRRGEPFPPGSRMTQRPGPYRQFLAAPTFDALDRLGAIARDRGTSLAGLALAWLLADERVAQIVVGPATPAQLAPVTEALAHPLTPAEQAAVNHAIAPAGDAGPPVPE